ncbi:unnamed protein product [Triticum turgidum subsp. durum]|uniref:Plant heme peroxidase family profile domain-containing protein n=1 Tax=Triticum turgidum subsp. durum TaxID=4567 RepID=A0A9R0T7P1_TRITD|nr:unnamed protein product [Triticum turgidum subsp. durum]
MASPSPLPAALLAVCALLAAMALFQGARAQQLSPAYYDESCPHVYDTVRRVIQEARTADPRILASLVRLQFHDCFVNGCDGSLLLDDGPAINSEKNAAPYNNSARGFPVVDDIKAALESACPGVVSCADIVALAAEVSVELAGGPYWRVLLGRRDDRTANFDAADNLPGPTDALNVLRQKFADVGLDDTDFVALQGTTTSPAPGSRTRRWTGRTCPPCDRAARRRAPTSASTTSTRPRRTRSTTATTATSCTTAACSGPTR